MDVLFRNYKSKLYPGGNVKLAQIDLNHFPGQDMYELFLHYLRLRNINDHSVPFNIYQIANELSFDLHDRYKFLLSSDEKKEAFLANRVKFQIHLLQQEEKSRDLYHLN
jgi:hypothetical protein